MISSNINKEVAERITDMRREVNDLKKFSPELAAELAHVPDIVYIDLWNGHLYRISFECPVRNYNV